MSGLFYNKDKHTIPLAIRQEGSMFNIEPSAIERFNV